MKSSCQIKMMGTLIDVQIEADEPSLCLKEIRQLLETYTLRFSANDKQSELNQVNQQAGIEAIQVHPDLFELIQIGKKHSLADPSNLNIAIGGLVQTWRIGFNDAKLPTVDEIQNALRYSDPRAIQLDSTVKGVYLEDQGMKLDLGALAKGYIADKVIDYARNHPGIQAILINLGGNVRVWGRNVARPDGNWLIGIQDPKRPRGENLGLLSIDGGSVVTSGIYERYLQIGNKRYHHIFDRTTGYPIETSLASLTIVAPTSLECELWTTRLFGLRLEVVLWQIEQEPGIEGILITDDNRIMLSSGLEKTFIWQRPS
ncbi:FAD:protein FMN transferase [Streptococcus sp. NLN76]|uniref:FAD:protein FMN transferase n=1 Tax=Streptococcus sp. NLN76 TaxID=2822800 RepID=UPI0018AB86FC|nr:FAD:protein FMN transferase [Streptococcus sp. NLN76]